MTKTITLALIASLACVVACGQIRVRCGGSRKCSPPIRPSACDLDVDTGTRTFTIAGVRVPEPTEGFDVDGLFSAQTDLAGCYIADGPDGTDNALATMFPSALVPVDGTDIAAPINEAVDDGTLAVDIVLERWNGTSSDDCVAVTLAVTERGIPLDPLIAEGALVDATIDDVAFEQDLALTPHVSVNPGGGFGTCEVDCETFALDLTIRTVLLRLAFDPAMTTLLWRNANAGTPASMIGGHVRYLGDDGSALRPSFLRLIESLDPFLIPTADDLFRRHLDLDSTPELFACTLVDGVPSADAFSMAMMMTSAPSE